MCGDKIKEWVQIALENEDVVDYSIELQGKSSKDNGYLGNIFFVTINGTTKNGTKTKLDLVIKASKENNHLRNQVPLKEVFEKEIYIYKQVKTTFDNFQKEKGINDEDLVRVIPYCYATRQTGSSELLVLENLKTKGYELLDRKVPMKFEHLKIILETYGKWHALSFALKKERPDTFKNLTENNINAYSFFIKQAKIAGYIAETFNTCKKCLDSDHEKEVLQKLNFSKEDIAYALSDLFFEEPDHQVILHGDGWTNNFMFKFEKNSTNPVDLQILDWQCSGLGSPVIDLSYFLYNCCPKECFDNFNALLEIYHNSLSVQLQKLGVEEVFSFDTLTRHWRKFSKHGLIMSAFILRFSLCEAEDAPDFEKLAEKGEAFVNNFYTFSVKNEDVYLERMKHNLLHYAQNA